MSLEILTKAVEDHGAAVKSLAGKVDGNQTKIEEALDRLQDLEMKGVKLRGGSESTSTKGAVHAFMKSSGMEAIRSGAKDTGRVELPAISIKALVSSGRGQAGDTQHATQAMIRAWRCSSWRC